MFAMVAVSLIAPAPQSANAAGVACAASPTSVDNNVATTVTLTGVDIFSAAGAAGAAATVPTATITQDPGDQAASVVTMTGVTGTVDAGTADTIQGTLPAANVAGTTTVATTTTTGSDNTCTSVAAFAFNGLSLEQGGTISQPSNGLTTQVLDIRGTIGGADLAATTVVTVTTDKGEFTATSSAGAVTPSKSVQLLLQGSDTGAATGNVTWRAVSGEATGTANFTVSATQGGTNLFKAVTGTVTAPTAGTPTEIQHVALSDTAIGYRSASQEYEPFVRGTRWVIRSADGANSGVAGRVIKVTTDRGYLVDALALGSAPTDAAIQGACDNSSTGPKTLFVSTVATGLGGTAGTTAVGRAAVVLCAGASSSAGSATITATDNTTPTITRTQGVTISNKPVSAGITASVSGNVVTVSVNGENGVAGPNKTKVNFSVIPTTDGSPVDACVLLKDGTASTTIAVAPGKNVQVLATIGESVDGLCATANTRTYGSAVVTVTGSTSTGTPPPSGDGSLTTPSFGSGNVGSAVFAGGTIAQLSAEVTAAGGTSVWAQTSSGTWVRYNTLATGATAFVNNAFMEAFAAGFDGPTAVFVVK